MNWNELNGPSRWDDGLILQSVFGWGGWVLLLLFLVTIYRRAPAHGALRLWLPALGAAWLLSIPFLVDGPGYIYEIAAHRSVPPLLLLPGSLRVAAELVFRLYEAIFAILATCWGTLLYREHLGGNF